MTKLKIRKIVLLSLDLILLAVCIIQGIIVNKDTTKLFKMTQSPDEIYIYNQGQEINLIFQGDKWYVGSSKEDADQTYVETLINRLSSIKAIDKVGSVKNEVYIEKYQLDEEKCISVVVKKNGEIIRSLQLGKTSSDKRQNYGTVDGSSDIYLLTGSLRGIFDLTEDELKDKPEAELTGEVSQDDLQTFIGNINDVSYYASQAYQEENE